MKDDVLGYECRFAIHIPSKNNFDPDIHLIKEQVHNKDGTITPNIRYVKNFERPYGITKPSKRNHQQKKEFELLENLEIKKTNQSKLRDQVAISLNKRWSRESLKDLSISPYLYGTDISSTAIIKKQYQDKFPNLVSAYSLGVFDVETDVLFGTKDIIIASLVFKDKAIISVVKSFLTGINDVDGLFRKKVDMYIKEYVDKRNLKIELHIAEDVVDCIKAVFNKAHEWKPDFLVIWNIAFDIPKVIENLEKNNVDPRDVLCEPSLPKEYRICKFKEGPRKKVTASGQVKPINPALQWHTLQCTSSFYAIDAMCVYRHLRITEAEEPSYSLDAILFKHLGVRKLKFKEADAYTELKWHEFMQEFYKIEYMVYNLFDCISILELDDVTKDLSYTLPSYSGISDFSDFKSQPKRQADALHFYSLAKTNRMIGTLGRTITVENKDVDDNDDDYPIYNDDIDDEALINDDYVTEEEKIPDSILSLKGWIVTLPAHLIVPGIKCIYDDPFLFTNIRAFVFDSDAVSAYPKATSCANVSRETTKRELIHITGVEEKVFRTQNLNLILGRVNATEYCVNMFNMPKPEEILDLF